MSFRPPPRIPITKRSPPAEIHVRARFALDHLRNLGLIVLVLASMLLLAVWR